MANRPGLALRAWLAATWALQPLLPWLLKRRLSRGKELPSRWREKLGYASLTRPNARLVWLHAVGLGEVLALRGLIAELARQAPDLHFLVTSGTRASAEVFARNLPPRTVHQFAPLDAPGPARRFLAHWRPDLSIWAEQELWPGLVYRADSAGIPLALVNARMNAPAPEAHGSLKPAAPPLEDQPEARAALAQTIGQRPVWIAAPTHPEDEALALAAHTRLLAGRPDALLILSPRLPARAPEILAAIHAAGLTAARRSLGEAPEAQVYLADTFGDLGLLYRLAPIAFIGGSMSAIEGHNPWEAAQLGCAILHGPRTGNFAADYAALDTAGAARQTATPDTLYQALTRPETLEMAARAQSLRTARMDRLSHLCQNLLELI